MPFRMNFWILSHWMRDNSGPDDGAFGAGIAGLGLVCRALGDRVDLLR
jgi:hypothetical protein